MQQFWYARYEPRIYASQSQCICAWFVNSLIFLERQSFIEVFFCFVLRLFLFVLRTEKKIVVSTRLKQTIDGPTVKKTHPFQNNGIPRNLLFWLSKSKR